MKTTIYVLLAAVLMTGCKFSKSAGKDLISGLTTTGNGLTSEDVYLTVNNERTTNTSFSYGETVYLVFNDLKGFTAENGYVFPLMEIIIMNLKGDTVLFAGDLYSEYTGGMNYSPLQLTADVTVAAPVKTGGEYTLNVNIYDRKGSGTFKSKLKFTVKGNENIKTEITGVTFNEAYIFSQGNDKVINNNKISFEDNIYLMVEGLKGFKDENGLVFPGLSLKGTDSGGNVILDYPDLFTEYGTTGVDVADFATNVSSHFKISGNRFSNPLHCEMVVWDKKSDSKLKFTTDLILE